MRVMGDALMTDKRVVLVDGVTGYWGQRVAEQLLLRDDVHVIGLDADNPHLGPLTLDCQGDARQ